MTIKYIPPVFSGPQAEFLDDLLLLSIRSSNYWIRVQTSSIHTVCIATPEGK